MLLPVDLMSMTSADSPTARARDGSSSDGSAAVSWLLAADADTLTTSGKDVINQIFNSYVKDGETDPAARFAADLKSLLSAHGVSLPPDQAGLPQAIGLAAGQPDGERAELAWSVDELLQMSVGPASGGNNLPVDDQTLPAVLSSLLAAFTAPAAEAATSTGAGGLESDMGFASATLSLVSGDSVSGLNSGVLAGSEGTTASGIPIGLITDAGESGSPATTGASDAGVAGSVQDMALRSALQTDAARQAAETAQVNPGSQKNTSEAANASAFRSIQFAQSGSGDTGSAADAELASQPALIRTGVPLERNQAITNQLSTALVAGGGGETPASSNSSQLFNPADGSAVMNRAEQRMFATESAQQAQSQAAQQTFARTAEGLPRFAMDTAFGQQGWSDSLGRQLMVMSSQGVNSAQIRLDPPELGSLTVKIQVSADQQTSVSFVSQHALVREALEQQLNRLQDLFRDQGLNLQDVSVSDQSPQQYEGEGGRQQGQGKDSGTGEQDPVSAEPVMVRSESLIDFYA